jgi:hypothetical protein
VKAYQDEYEETREEKMLEVNYSKEEAASKKEEEEKKKKEEEDEKKA